MGLMLEEEKDGFENRFRDLCRNMEITLSDEYFIYFFDHKFAFETSIINITPDYKGILRQGLASLKYRDEDCTNEFCRRYNSVVDSLLMLTARLRERLDEERPLNYEKKADWFRRLKHKEAESLDEAMQRILFLNQLLWQTGSRLVGLGRMDMLLYPYYKKDMENKKLTRQQASELIQAFLGILHRDYRFKSSELHGDTGQVIVLGGSERGGGYLSNDLTGIFLECAMKSRISDPKIVLRVNREIQPGLMEQAVQCMLSGIGGPLLSNDDLIIPKLMEFGVAEEDAYEYGTSACWEPLIVGKSSSMNNHSCLSYMKALHRLLMEERLDRLTTFETLKERVYYYLRRELRVCERNLYCHHFFRNTLYSVFIEGCKDTKKDIVEGGAKYHHIGMTTVGLGNLINAMWNLRHYVFEEKRYSLLDVKKMCLYDFSDYQEAIPCLKNSKFQYGMDEDEIIELTNEILRFVTDETKDFRTPIGGRLKFGVSSPAYIIEGREAPASFDGRRKGEPFMVHISNERASAYTEIINFASRLDYGGNRLNGNVVDLMVNTSLMERHLDKFVILFLQAIKAGFFQLQTNVLKSELLLAAKEAPERYPGLIVRVWGFNAYFVELPEIYQDMLINRALENEARSTLPAGID